MILCFQISAASTEVEFRVQGTLSFIKHIKTPAPWIHKCTCQHWQSIHGWKQSCPLTMNGYQKSLPHTLTKASSHHRHPSEHPKPDNICTPKNMSFSWLNIIKDTSNKDNYLICNLRIRVGLRYLNKIKF